MRERGTDKYSTNLRFIYNVPTAMKEKSNSWVAVPKHEDLRSTLFNKRTDTGHVLRLSTDSMEHNEKMERHMFSSCTVLIEDQRCADWFLLRQFQITGTNGGKILMSDGHVRLSLVIISITSNSEMTLTAMLQLFVRTWFTSSRSTEHMMRGTANEPAVFLL